RDCRPVRGRRRPQLSHRLRWGAHLQFCRRRISRASPRACTRRALLARCAAHRRRRIPRLAGRRTVRTEKQPTFRWAILLAMTFSAAVAGDERSGTTPQQLKLSTAQGPAYPMGKAGEVWATLIRERSGGLLAVAHYPGATLSSRDPARELLALREGSIDLAVGSTLAWSMQVPELNVLALPWLVPDASALD